MTFTQSFTSILYNVTAVKQSDSTSDYGPAYLLNGLSNAGYWYQVGLTWNWNPGNNPGTGFDMIYEVFNPNGNSIFPTGGGGGLLDFSGTVNQGDSVALNLYFTNSSQVVLLAKDYNTGAYASEVYSNEGATYFTGLSQTSNSNGFFTGLMTEWYHPNVYYGSEQPVTYSSTYALSSAYMWVDEWNFTSGHVALFSDSSGLLSYSDPTQLQEFASHGATEYSDAYQYISGATSQTPLTLSYSVEGGGSGYSPPTLTYVTGGVTTTATLSTTATTYNVDPGSSWSVNPTLAGSSSSERWQTDQAYSGTASSSQTINFVYYNQYLQTLSYSVSDSSIPPTPTFTTNQFGAPVDLVLSTSPAGYWFDSGASWSVSNPIAGGTGERWSINSTLQADGGMISSAQTLDFVYYHQFQVTLTVSPHGDGTTTPSGSDLWENAGPLAISATGSESYVFSTWSSSTTSITFANADSPTTTATISGAGTITATFTFQPLEEVQVSISMSPANSSPVTVAVSGCDASITSVPADGNLHAFTADALCSLTFTAPAETGTLVWEFSNSGTGSATWTYTTGNAGTETETNTLFTLDRDTVEYSVSGGGTGYSAPTLSFQALGSPKTYTMTTTGTEVDIDDGSSWTVTNPLTSSGSGERWIASTSTLSGTSAGGTKIDPTFYHQFFLTISGGVGLTSQWYNSSATAQLSVPGTYGRASGSGERVASYSIDGGAAVVVPPTSGMVSISVLMNSAHSLSIDSVQQYQVSLDKAAASALSFISPSTISGDDYWYDAGTTVNLVLNGVWNRTSSSGERLLSYSLNGASVNVSTAGSVDVLSGPLSSPEAVSGVVTTQYHLTADTGSIASVTAPSIAGDAGWYDSGTQVALTYNYSWNDTSGNSRLNAVSYAVGGNETVLKRSGSGTFLVQLSMVGPEVVTITSVTQYSFTVSGGYDVSLSLPSPTGDAFYDAGTTLTATTDYTWGIVNNDTRQNLVSFTLDSSTTNVTRESSGSFATPSIAFSSAHTLVFNSVTQDLVTLTFKDNTGTQTITPSSVEIQLDDPTIVTVPPSGVWLDGGTRFQIYDVEWEGTDVKPTNQTIYTVSGPLNQTVLDRIYSGTISVTDYLGLPVSGAKVSVTLANGSTISTTTGSNGSVALRDIPLGTYLATISYLGTTTSVNGNAATGSTVHAKILASYPTFGIIATLVVVIAVAFLFVLRRRQGDAHISSSPVSTSVQPQDVGATPDASVCQNCGSTNSSSAEFCQECGKQLR